jgi:phosphoglycolate phosphatase-like HAD superfamily hydrolase
VSISSSPRPEASQPTHLTGWDKYDAYLFDIDGTLLRSRDRIHYNSFQQCMLDVLGRNVSIDNVPVHGSTDTGILRDALEQAGIAHAEWLHREAEILESMRQIVFRQRGQMQPEVLPAVTPVLQYLQQKQATLGLATGNLEAIGWLKVELAGLRSYFTFGGFSDRFPARADMVAFAAEQARAQAGSAATLCIVGDTPSDIRAARANALPTIAVATGRFSLEELAHHQPEYCIPTLAELLLPAHCV